MEKIDNNVSYDIGFGSDKSSSVLVDKEGKVLGFIDGVKDVCDHKWTGPTIFTDTKGKQHSWLFLKPKERAKMSPEFWEALFYEEAQKEELRIRTACSTCIHCNKPFSPPIF